MRANDLTGLYEKGDWLLFGAETTGLPEEVREGAQLLKVQCKTLSSSPSGINCHLYITAFKLNLLQLQSPPMQ